MKAILFRCTYTPLSHRVFFCIIFLFVFLTENSLLQTGTDWFSMRLIKWTCDDNDNVIIIQHMYSDPLEYSKLTFINRHQHENTKISTRNANFCSFLLNTFFFDFNSINTEKKLFSVFVWRLVCVYIHNENLNYYGENIVHRRMRTNIYSDISLYSLSSLLCFLLLRLTLLFSLTICRTIIRPVFLKKGNIF